jgi:hypothetical protein
MAKTKKETRRKKSVGKKTEGKKSASRKAASTKSASGKTASGKTASGKTASAKTASAKTGALPSKPARSKKVTRPGKRSRPKQIARSPRRFPLVTSLDVAATSGRRGLGAGSAGQSGDTQGLSNAEDADSESVEELVEEGQSFEAGVVTGVEDADTAREVRTRQVPEDDVPLEYLEKD